MLAKHLRRGTPLILVFLVLVAVFLLDTSSAHAAGARPVALPSPIEDLKNWIAWLAYLGLRSFLEIVAAALWIFARVGLSFYGLVDTTIQPLVVTLMGEMVGTALQMIRPAIYPTLAVAIGLVALQQMAAPWFPTALRLADPQRLLIWALVFAMLASGSPTAYEGLFYYMEGSPSGVGVRANLERAFLDTMFEGSDPQTIILQAAGVHPDDVNAVQLAQLPLRDVAEVPPATQVGPCPAQDAPGIDPEGRSIGARFHCAWPEERPADPMGTFASYIPLLLDGTARAAITLAPAMVLLLYALIRVLLMLAGVILFTFFPVALLLAFFLPFESFAMGLLRAYFSLLLQSVLIGIVTSLMLVLYFQIMQVGGVAGMGAIVGWGVLCSLVYMRLVGLAMGALFGAIGSLGQGLGGAAGLGGAFSSGSWQGALASYGFRGGRGAGSGAGHNEHYEEEGESQDGGGIGMGDLALAAAGMAVGAGTSMLLPLAEKAMSSGQPVPPTRTEPAWGGRSLPTPQEVDSSATRRWDASSERESAVLPTRTSAPALGSGAAFPFAESETREDAALFPPSAAAFLEQSASDKAEKPARADLALEQYDEQSQRTLRQMAAGLSEEDRPAVQALVGTSAKLQGQGVDPFNEQGEMRAGFIEAVLDQDEAATSAFLQLDDPVGVLRASVPPQIREVSPQALARHAAQADGQHADVPEVVAEQTGLPAARLAEQAPALTGISELAQTWNLDAEEVGTLAGHSSPQAEHAAPVAVDTLREQHPGLRLWDQMPDGEADKLVEHVRTLTPIQEASLPPVEAGLGRTPRAEVQEEVDLIPPAADRSATEAPVETPLVDQERSRTGTLPDEPWTVEGQATAREASPALTSAEGVGGSSVQTTPLTSPEPTPGGGSSFTQATPTPPAWGAVGDDSHHDARPAVSQPDGEWASRAPAFSEADEATPLRRDFAQTPDNGDEVAWLGGTDEAWGDADEAALSSATADMEGQEMEGQEAETAGLDGTDEAWGEADEAALSSSTASAGEEESPSPEPDELGWSDPDFLADEEPEPAATPSPLTDPAGWASVPPQAEAARGVDPQAAQASASPESTPEEDPLLAWGWSEEMLATFSPEQLTTLEDLMEAIERDPQIAQEVDSLLIGAGHDPAQMSPAERIQAVAPLLQTEEAG